MKLLTLADIQKHRRSMIETRTFRLSELFNELIAVLSTKHESIFGQPTQMWPIFNSAFGGYRPGELIIVTADTGVGKSTFLMNLYMDCGRLNYPAILISLENTWRRTAIQVAQMISGKHFTSMQDAEIGSISEVMKGLPLWYLDYNGPIKEETFLDLVSYVAKELGIKVIFLDHFDYIDKGRESWSHESSAIGESIRKISGAAKANDVTIFSIVHPKKLEERGIKHREIGMDELRGSSALKQEPDAIFSLFRPDPEKPVSQLRFLKIRHHEYGKSIYGKIRFQMNPVSLIYHELSTGLEWDSND